MTNICKNLNSTLLILCFLSFINLLAQSAICIPYKQVIFFGYDESSLTSDAMNKLDNFIYEFKRQKHQIIKVNGFTDIKGNPDYNKKLCSKRIKSVVDYLAAHGVNKDEITTNNMGSTDEFAGNSTNEASLKLNRRVELILISKSEATLKNNTAAGINQNDDRNDILTMDTRFIIEHELKKLASDKIIFDVPPEITESESDYVNVLLKNDFIDDLNSKLKNNTYKIFEKFRKIELSGLSLTANNIEINKIKDNDSGKWTWKITPLESGLHTISLDMSLNYITSKGDTGMLYVPILLKAVNIVDKPFYRVSVLLRKTIFILFILIVALGIFTIILKKNKKPQNLK